MLLFGGTLNLTLLVWWCFESVVLVSPRLVVVRLLWLVVLEILCSYLVVLLILRCSFGGA